MEGTVVVTLVAVVASVMFLIIWAVTPTVFWPMTHELYGAATGKMVRSDAELIALAGVGSFVIGSESG